MPAGSPSFWLLTIVSGPFWLLASAPVDDAAFDHRPDRRHTHLQQVHRLAIEDDGIELLARLEAAHAVVPVDGVRRVDGRGHQRLLHRHTHAEAGQGHGEGHRGGESATRVEIGGQRHGHTAFDEFARRREAAELQVERRDGQQRGDNACVLHGVNAAGGDVQQVVSRSGAHLRGDKRAAAFRQFVGMDAGLEAVPLAGLQDLLGLVGRVDACLAEDVAPLGEAVTGRGRDHLPDELVDVEPAVRPVLDRNLMGPHERRDQLERMLRVEPADDAQHLELRVRLQPVPALGLARRRAAAEHLVQPGPGGRGQAVLGGLARGAHRGEDAAALGGDLGVGGAGKAAAELLPPVAAEHDVGVRVHEARHHRAARCLDDRRAGARRAEAVGVSGRPDERDDSVGGDNRRVADRSRIRLGRAELGCAARAGEHHPGVADDGAGRHGGAGASRGAR